MSLDSGVAYYSGGLMTLVLDNGDDSNVLDLTDIEDVGTDDLDEVLADESIARTGSWVIGEDGELEAPILLAEVASR